MVKIELSEKNKNKILNFGIIILALFIAFQIFKWAEEQMSVLSTDKKNELKKNEIMQEIAGLEEKIKWYKQVFTKKDISYVFDAVSRIAKNSSVKFISIKPIDDETNPDYVKSSFLVTVSSSDYHSLGNFISQIEANEDIYLVGEVSINSRDSNNSMQGDDQGLILNLKISTILFKDEPS